MVVKWLHGDRLLLTSVSNLKPVVYQRWIRDTLHGVFQSLQRRTDLTVQAQKQQHDEEEDGPQGWQRHHGHSFRVSDEGQARTWRENREGGMGRRG